MIDFSKAFDTVDHVILLNKLTKFSPPAFVVNWICSYLTNRGQQCKFNGSVSDILKICLSIVQGSGIGPTLYLIMKSDLHTVSAINDIFKYADDTTLLVPENTDVQLEQEFQHVLSWAANNHLIINPQKTKELVFRRPRVQYFHLPNAVDNIEQVNSAKLLGVLFQSNFKMDSHVQFIMKQCAQRMYLLKLLMHQGMSAKQLSIVTLSIIVSRIVYALPAWSSFLSAENTDKINAFLRRLRRFGYLSYEVTLNDLIHKYDYDLYCKMCKPDHCLNHMLHTRQNSQHNLREHGHVFELPSCNTDVYKQTFINRVLFRYV
jgi:hypothetical protein